MKILIIKPSSFGDIVHAQPVVGALKAMFPHASISWLVFDRFKELINMFHEVDTKITWDRKKGIFEYLRVISEVRKNRYDLVIDLQGLLRTALIAFLSGAKKKIGVPGMKECSWLLVKEPFPDKKSLYAVKRNMQPLVYLFHKEFEPQFTIKILRESWDQAFTFLMEYGISSIDRIVCIVPNARGASKIWPRENYQILARRIVSHYRDIKVLIVDNTRGLYRDFNNNDNIFDISGKTTVTELAAILKHSALVIGNDTGPVQLAAALQIPTIAIFGGSDVNETGPQFPNTVIIKKRYPCSPCRTTPACDDYGCLKDITPDEVFQEVKKQLP